MLIYSSWTQINSTRLSGFCFRFFFITTFALKSAQNTKATLCRRHCGFSIICWLVLSCSLWLCVLALCWCCQWVCIGLSPDPHYWPPSCQRTWECTQASTQFLAGHSTHAGISTGKPSIHCG